MSYYPEIIFSFLPLSSSGKIKMIIKWSHGQIYHVWTIDILSSVCNVLPFLPWDCLLPICSTYTKLSTHEVLQPLNKVARIKYWILPSVCDSVLWSFLFFTSILISILIDHYTVSPSDRSPGPPRSLRKEKLLPQMCCKILPRNLTCLYVEMPHTENPPNPPRPQSDR